MPLKKLATTMLTLLALAALAGGAWADCPDFEVQCWGPHPDTGEMGQMFCGSYETGSKWDDSRCKPVANADGGKFCYYRQRCQELFPKCCGKKCYTWGKVWLYQYQCPAGWNKP